MIIFNRRCKWCFTFFPQKLGGSGTIKSNRYSTEYHRVRRSLDYNTNKSIYTSSLSRLFWLSKQHLEQAFVVVLSLRQGGGFLFAEDRKRRILISHRDNLENKSVKGHLFRSVLPWAIVQLRLQLRLSLYPFSAWALVAVSILAGKILFFSR